MTSLKTLGRPNRMQRFDAVDGGVVDEDVERLACADRQPVGGFPSSPPLVADAEMSSNSAPRQFPRRAACPQRNRRARRRMSRAPLRVQAARGSRARARVWPRNQRLALIR
jgi:hypothetical protein